MTAPDLRPYQSDVIAEFFNAAAGTRRILLVAPTGSGKTIIGAAVIREYTRALKRVLVLAHRREIIMQTVGKLRLSGVYPGIIMAGVKPRPLEPVQLASIQTLWARSQRGMKQDNKWWADDGRETFDEFVARTETEAKAFAERKAESGCLPLADLVVVDEAHHSPAMTYSKIIAAYPDAVLLGLTATPCRGDGRGLGGIFDAMIECPQVPDLIDGRYLVPTRTYAPIDPDLTGVQTRRGDYVEAELADRMDRAKLVGDIVSHWFKYGERRKTVCFAVNVAHSVHIRDEFVKSGVRCEHIDGSTPKPERDATLARLATGEIEVVTNCMVLCEGWDMPEVGCCVLARPTKKMGLYRQMIGRVLRPAPDKVDAIVLDHSGAVFRHGFVEDRVVWTLDPDRKAENPTHAKRSKEHGSRLVECSQCGALRQAGEACFHCGFLPQRAPRWVPCVDGDLGLVDRNRRAIGNNHDPATREQWQAMLIWIADERDYKPGWVAYKFKEKFGEWPPWGAAPEPIPPTAECRSWVRSRMIAYAKRMDVA